MKELTKYIEDVSIKYPEANKNMIKDIANDIFRKMNKDNYKPSWIVANQLGLNPKYFSIAHSRKSELKAKIIKKNNFLYVKLDEDIQSLLNDGFICCKITKEEMKSFDTTIFFSKNTLLGFYK